MTKAFKPALKPTMNPASKAPRKPGTKPATAVVQKNVARVAPRALAPAPRTGTQIRPGDETKAIALQMAPQRRGKAPRHFVDMSADERVEALEALGHKGFRAKQLALHYFEHFQADPEDFTDIPSSARKPIADALFPQLLRPTKMLEADRGTTVKTLWHLYDDARIESVLMRYPRRTTLCISSQAGCGMACPFCATGQMGFIRNLSAAEMLEQVRLSALALSRGELPGGPTRLNNLVFMGMGEGMVNYKAMMIAIRSLVAPTPEGFGMSARNITVSTVGLVPGMRKLAEEGLPLRLALSLHAPDDDLRDELIPINSKYKVDETIDAAYDYFKATGRRVSIEYALIKDMNDHAWRADLLAKVLNKRGRGWVHVNPIPLNPTPGSIWTASEKNVEQIFVERLRAHGIPTTVRDTRGSDIDGACGQLAAEEEDE